MTKETAETECVVLQFPLRPPETQEEEETDMDEWVWFLKTTTNDELIQMLNAIQVELMARGMKE